MTSRHRHVFEPMLLGGHLEMRNRVFFAPMGIDLASDHGNFSPALLEFYRGVLEGGCGLAFLSNATVSASSRLQESGLCLFNESQADSLECLFALSTDCDTPIGVQLQHYGGQGATTLTGEPVLTPSGVACPRISKLDPHYSTRVMDVDDIALVIEQFAHSAWLAWRAGARLVQLQASNGYLLSSFLSPYTNRRTDRYGGTEENRARLLLEVIAAIIRRTEGQLIVTVRLGIDDRLGDAGLQFRDLRETVQALGHAGVAAIECSMCVGKTFQDFLGYSESMDTYLQNGVRHIKSISSVPVGYAGFVDGLDKAEYLLESGVCDWVGMSRALFADNDLIVKTLTGQEHLIHKCRWEGNCFRDKSDPRLSRVYCCVNPKYLRPNLN